MEDNKPIYPNYKYCKFADEHHYYTFIYIYAINKDDLDKRDIYRIKIYNRYLGDDTDRYVRDFIYNVLMAIRFQKPDPSILDLRGIPMYEFIETCDMDTLFEKYI